MKTMEKRAIGSGISGAKAPASKLVAMTRRATRGT